ncbi:hypothetical protein ON010_g14919 [Phytophthora cinnamomi]|nr:hypothetical protein ON010_g14919 [Phytophthora cinnamomi]
MEQDVHSSRLKYYADKSLEVTEEIREHVAAQGIILTVAELVEHRWNNLFLNLRVVVLQDAALFRDLHQAYELWACSPSNAAEFDAFAIDLKTNMKTEKSPQTMHLHEVVPDLMEHDQQPYVSALTGAPDVQDAAVAEDRASGLARVVGGDTRWSSAEYQSRTSGIRVGESTHTITTYTECIERQLENEAVAAATEQA